MLKVFYGEDRAAAQAAIRRLLGEEYEVFDGEELSAESLVDIFWGASLLSGSAGRRILLKDASDQPEIWAKLADFLPTEHTVVVWEHKLDKRTSAYKALAAAGAEFQEFAAPPPDSSAVFSLLELALADGPRALRQLEQIQFQQDPFMLMGLFTTQALKRFQATLRRSPHGGRRERALLKKLAAADLAMKTGTEPWLAIKTLLLELSALP